MEFDHWTAHCDPEHWCATGVPTCSDFRARDVARTASKNHWPAECQNKPCRRLRREFPGRQRQHRNERKATARTIDEGRDLFCWMRVGLVGSEIHKLRDLNSDVDDQDDHNVSDDKVDELISDEESLENFQGLVANESILSECDSFEVDSEGSRWEDDVDWESIASEEDEGFLLLQTVPCNKSICLFCRWLWST